MDDFLLGLFINALWSLAEKGIYDGVPLLLRKLFRKHEQGEIAIGEV